EVVVYLGTPTKILAPAMRVGWLAASPRLAARLAAAGGTLGEYASGPAQDALLSLITTGDLERHIRRMRHDYARRRAAMTAVFGGGAAGRLLGDQAGMHIVLETSEPAADVAVAAAERRGAAGGGGGGGAPPGPLLRRAGDQEGFGPRVRRCPAPRRGPRLRDPRRRPDRPMRGPGSRHDVGDHGLLVGGTTTFP